MVEFTLVAPLLLSLGLGVAEFGNMLQNYHVIDKGVRDAARYLGHRNLGTCTSGALTGSDADTAKNLAVSGNLSGTPLKLSYWDQSTITITVSCVDNSTGIWRGETSIPIITVSASVPYSGIGFLAALGLPSITFNTQHEEQNLPD